MPSAHATAPRLVADIGGSNARFGWALGNSVQHVEKLSVAAHATLAAAATSYLRSVGARLGAQYVAPREAAIAVAATVTGDEVDLTNSPWTFSIARLRDELALERLVVLNDFEALALALPHLGAAQLRAHGALRSLQLPRAVIGPGTGLGVAAVVPHASGWIALPGEGGHATLAPGNDFESDLIAHVRRSHAHVSAERLLSGIGLPVLHGAVAATLGTSDTPLVAEEIVTRGAAGSDAVCRRTLDVFCALLGSFAGNVALTVGARGGVYIGGGIVPRIAELFFASRFRERFESKGRLQGYLREIPTALITDTLAALAGAAAALDDGTQRRAAQ